MLYDYVLPLRYLPFNSDMQRAHLMILFASPFAVSSRPYTTGFQEVHRDVHVDICLAQASKMRIITSNVHRSFDYYTITTSLSRLECD